MPQILSGTLTLLLFKILVYDSTATKYGAPEMKFWINFVQDIKKKKKKNSDIMEIKIWPVTLGQTIIIPADAF